MTTPVRPIFNNRSDLTLKFFIYFTQQTAELNQILVYPTYNLHISNIL